MSLRLQLRYLGCSKQIPAQLPTGVVLSKPLLGSPPGSAFILINLTLCRHMLLRLCLSVGIYVLLQSSDSVWGRPLCFLFVYLFETGSLYVAPAVQELSS